MTDDAGWQADDARGNYQVWVDYMRSLPPPKIDVLRRLMAAGDWRGAVGVAAKFPQLGEHREAITRAWGAYTRPDFYRQIGKDPEALIAAGRAALEARYGR